MTGAFSAAAAAANAQQKKRERVRTAALVTDAPAAPASSNNGATNKRPLKVLIAGAGIGGLVLAVALLKKGIQVEVFERDITAIRGEGKYRGPIQVGFVFLLA